MSKRAFITESAVELLKKQKEAAEAAGGKAEELPYDPRPLYERLQEQREKEEEAELERVKNSAFIGRGVGWSRCAFIIPSIVLLLLLQ